MIDSACTEDGIDCRLFDISNGLRYNTGIEKGGISSMKSLNALQTIAKIGRTLSMVAFILSIVAGAVCIAGIFSLLVFPEDGFKLFGVTIRGLMEKEANVSISTVYAKMACGIVLCAGEAVLAKFAERYFKHELQAGTPFTFDGAKELMRLGILAICISIGTAILAGIVSAVFKTVAPNTADPVIDNGASVVIGVMMIVGSLLCRHGAEVSEKSETV